MVDFEDKIFIFILEIGIFKIIKSPNQQIIK